MARRTIGSQVHLDTPQIATARGSSLIEQGLLLQRVDSGADPTRVIVANKAARRPYVQLKDRGLREVAIYGIPAVGAEGIM